MLTVLLAVHPSGPICGAYQTETAARLEGPGALSSRFLADTGAGRILFVDVQDPRRPEKDYTALGFSSPLLNLGPVDLGGLLRELGNPLAYGAGSPVFQEDTRLNLHIGMDRSSRQGLWANVPGGLFGIGGFIRNGEELHAAATVSAGQRGGPQLSALVLASNPPAGRVPDDWFPPRPIYPGGSLFHLAGRSLTPLGSLTGGESLLGISWGISRGSLVPAAAFFHLHGIHRSPRLETGFMAGTCGADYLTPAGSYPADRQAVAALVRAFPKGPLSPWTRLRAQQGRTESLPTRCVSRKQELEGGLDIRGKTARLSLDGAANRELSPGGRISQRRLARASAAYRGKKIWLDGGFKGEWRDALLSQIRVSGEAAYRPAPWDWGLGLSFNRTNRTQLSGSLRGARASRGTRIEAELGLQDFPADSGGGRALINDPLEYFYFSLGWRIRR